MHILAKTGWVLSLGIALAAPQLAVSQVTSSVTPGAANAWQGVLKEHTAAMPDASQEQLVERGRYSDVLTGLASGTIDDSLNLPRGGHSGSGEPDEELPTDISDAVVVATFTDYDFVISPSRKSVYTDIAFAIDEGLKPKGAFPAGKTITVVYPGGTIRTQSGTVVSVGVDAMDFAVRPGGQYLLFLQYNSVGNFSVVLKSWKVSKGLLLTNTRLDRARGIKGESQVAGKSLSVVKSAVKLQLASK